MQQIFSTTNRQTNPTTTMEKPQVTAWLKTQCGWSNGVRAVMQKYAIAYTEKDIIKNPAFRWEMEQRSGQPLSPCVEVNGVMLADISGEEVERYMLEQGLVSETGNSTDVPLNAPCSNEQHEAMRRGEPVNFRTS
jgi:monothiol glutaredoxin